MSHHVCSTLLVSGSLARPRTQLTVLPVRESKEKDKAPHDQKLVVLHIIENSRGNSFAKETKYQGNKK
jgi:hypothetical protein